MFLLVSRILFYLWLSAIIVSSLVDYSTFSSVKITTEGSAGLIYHFVAYFGVAILSWIGFREYGIKIILKIGFALLLINISLELVQIYLPYRTFNPKDIVANTAGLVSGYICVIIWQGIQKCNRSDVKV